MKLLPSDVRIIESARRQHEATGRVTFDQLFADSGYQHRASMNRTVSRLRRGGHFPWTVTITRKLTKPRPKLAATQREAIDWATRAARITANGERFNRVVDAARDQFAREGIVTWPALMTATMSTYHRLLPVVKQLRAWGHFPWSVTMLYHVDFDRPDRDPDPGEIESETRSIKLESHPLHRTGPVRRPRTLAEKCRDWLAEDREVRRRLGLIGNRKVVA